jgi:protein-S-isoprenylcysteine O-methyltransferase Ste14
MTAALQTHPMLLLLLLLLLSSARMIHGSSMVCFRAAGAATYFLSLEILHSAYPKGRKYKKRMHQMWIKCGSSVTASNIKRRDL